MRSNLDELQVRDVEIEKLRQTLNEVTILNNELREDFESAKRNKVEMSEQARKLQSELREVRMQALAAKTNHDNELREEKMKQKMLYSEIKDREAKFNKTVDSMRSEKEGVRQKLEQF